MLVKCRICGKKTEKSEAYRVETKVANEYYCSEREYLEHKRKREEDIRIKNEIYDILTYIFGYKVVNTALFKELTDIHQGYPYEDMLYYLQQDKDYIKNALSKDFHNEYARIKYFSAVCKNRIYDCLQTFVCNTVKKEISPITEYKYVPQKKREHKLKEKEDNYKE